MLGLQQSAQSLGQVFGALLGTLLLGWSAPAPYFLAAVILAGLALINIAQSRR